MKRFVISIISFLLCVPFVCAQDFNVELVSHIGGSIEDVQIVGDYAYCATGNGFAIFDISDPEESHKISSFQLGSAADIKVAHGYAYVASPGSGLQIFDVGDPYQPVHLNSYDYHATAIDVQGDYAYMGCAFWGVYILNISDPTNIELVAIYDYDWAFMDYAITVKISGDYLFVADLEHSVRVVDVSDPENPIHVNAHPMEYVWEIELTDGYAYFGGRSFWIYQMPHPTAMEEIYSDTLWVDAIRVIDNYAYMLRGSLTSTRIIDSPYFRVIDVTDPSQPTEVVHHVLPEHGKPGVGAKASLTVIGDYAYAALGSGGLRIFDISDLLQPVRLFRSEMPGSARGISVRDQYAYLADSMAGLVAFDISQPEAVHYVSHYQDIEFSRNIMLADTYAYLTSWPDGLSIIDISDLDNLYEVGSYDSLENAFATFVVDDYAYVADYASGLHILDVRDPSHPIRVARFLGQITDVEVSGGYAFLADQSGEISGLRVLNVQNPNNPVEVGFYPAIGHYWGCFATGITLEGQYGYLSGGPGGLYIYDISDPRQVELIGGYDWQGVLGPWAEKVAVHDRYAYMPAESGLFIFDIDDPRNVSLAAAYSSPGWTTQIAVHQGHIYLPIQSGGLLVLSSETLSVEESELMPAVDDQDQLRQNYPNPFNPATTIRFFLSETTPVQLSIYNINGQLVNRLLAGTIYEAGSHSVTWNGVDNKGNPVVSGVYLYRLKTNRGIQTRRMTLLR
ncbi:MAG: hypothetical protein B6244_14615 [Candidatus Cloacimonetes bacterium 4572_55]|nr:MAG: hypothetical protein B6244_14615 [Candidatus Cloacimonetes bacterium 4572_55]